MARPSKAEVLNELHAEALAEFDAIQSAMHDERMQCLEDRRFGQLAGAQWEGALGDQFENKPRFEVNKVRPSVLRIENEYRNNRVGVVFQPKDGAPKDQLADTCAALFRADEQDSVADEAYDGAFDEAVTGGFGAFRLRGCYADEDDEDGEDDQDEARPQRIRIEHIPDADSSVFFDLNAKRQDKSDARTCFVLTPMTRDEYERRYDDDPTTWEKSVHKTEFDWAPPDVVVVAEYYVVESVSETYITFQGLEEGDEREHAESALEADEGLSRELEATGYKEASRRTTTQRRVHKYLLSGNSVLEDCGFIAGRQIPIIPVYGQRSFVDNVERCMGHVRLAKDAQRLLNMLLSKLAEISSMTSVSKPIFTPEQIAGHTSMWSNDNIRNYPYLLVNAVMDAAGTEALSGPVGYTKAPEVPPILAALVSLAEVGLKDVLGNPQEAEKMVSHVAGKTVELLQRTLDKQAFIYVSNMAKAIRRCGQVWLSMARELYKQPGRKMKGITALNKPMQVELMRPVIGPDKKAQAENDLTRAAFDVNVNIGLSSESKRQAASSAITGLLAVTQDEETRTVLGLFGVMNLEGEGVEDLREWARAQLVKKGAVKPTPEEAEQLAAMAQNAPKDPNATYLEAAAKKAEADAARAVAEIDLTAAKTQKTKADTIETLAGVDVSRQGAAIDAAKSLQELSAPQPSLDQGLGTSAPVPGGSQ